MTKFKIKNKGIEFKIGKAVHMIPSKDFPLSSKNTKNIKVFTNKNTKKIKNEKIQEIFNNLEYRLGKCFANARDLQAMLEKEGIQGWEYYSGWLFLPGGYPIFHAWLVKDDSVLEYTDFVFDENMNEKMKGIKTDEEQREILANEMVRKSKLPASETKTYGNVHMEHIFIGTKDTYENSRVIMEGFAPSHPSYSPKGMNLEGLSDLQLRIEEIKNKS